MEKKAKIAISVVLVLAIAVPSIWFGIDWYLKQQISSAEIEITDVSIQELNDSNMSIYVGFKISTNKNITATFAPENMILNYKAFKLGNIQFMENELRTEAYLTTLVLVSITNETLYTEMISNFVDNEKMNLTVKGDIKFLEELSVLPLQQVEKEIEIAGLGGLKPSVKDFKLLESGPGMLKFNTTVRFNNPSNINCTLTPLWVDIKYNNQLVGNASRASYNLINGENIVVMNATFGGNNSALEQIIGNYVMGSNTSFQLLLNTTVSVGSTSKSISILTTSAVELEGVSEPIISVKNIQIGIVVNMNWGGATGSATVTITVLVNNPTPISLNVTHFNGSVYFDDKDGFNYGMYSAPAQNNIFIQNISMETKFNETNPLQLDPNGQSVQTTNYDPLNDFTLSARLWDEQNKNQLYVDIKNAELGLSIDGFSLLLKELSFLHIKVN